MRTLSIITPAALPRVLIYLNPPHSDSNMAKQSDSDSDIEASMPETSDTSTKKSWVWQYFKAATIDSLTYNLCQAIAKFLEVPISV